MLGIFLITCFEFSLVSSFVLYCFLFKFCFVHYSVSVLLMFVGPMCGPKSQYIHTVDGKWNFKVYSCSYILWHSARPIYLKPILTGNFADFCAFSVSHITFVRSIHSDKPMPNARMWYMITAGADNQWLTHDCFRWIYWNKLVNWYSWCIYFRFDVISLNSMCIFMLFDDSFGYLIMIKLCVKDVWQCDYKLYPTDLYLDVLCSINIEKQSSNLTPGLL